MSDSGNLHVQVLPVSEAEDRFGKVLRGAKKK
jgi:hypothetical protein